jgi:hypothetical protein
MIKLAILFLLAASPARAQTNVPPRTPAPPLASPGFATNAQTNQDLSPLQLGEQVRADCLRGRRLICGRILRLVPEGLIVECGYTNLMRDPLDKSWLVPGSVQATRESNLVEGNEPDSLCAGVVLLTDLPRSRAAKPQQYDYVIIRGYPTGHHTYASVGDVKKTVRRFSASLAQAVKTNYAAAEDSRAGHSPASK